MTTPRDRMIWNFLEAAKDMGDVAMIATARRLVRANTLGWKKHAAAADVAVFVEWRDQ